jgi:hypothetical protein
MNSSGDQERCMIVRTDDHGLTYLVLDGLFDYQAEAFLAQHYGHKQFYTKLAYRPSTRAQIILEHDIIE